MTETSKETKRKVLMIAPTPFFSDRGTHIRILEEALALIRRGFAVTIATYHIGQDLPEPLAAQVEVRRIRRLLFWYQKLEAGPDWQKLVLDLMLIRKVFFLARTTRPDILHGHLHEGVLIGWIVQKVLFWRGMKLVGDFHGSLTKEMVSHAYLRAGLLRRLFEWVERVVDDLGDQAVTSSWRNTREIAALRKKSTPITVPDGVGTDDEASIEFPRAALRHKYGISEDALVVTYTGALVANKGIRHFVNAIPAILAGDPRAHVVVAGFPWNEVAPYFEGKHWMDRVTPITPLPYFSLREILAMSDVGIDPKEEGVGQASGKMLQYMGAGLPVACFDTENNREYLADGGEYARDLSGSGLAAAVLRLLRDPELRRRKGVANQARAKEKFSWDRAGEILEGVYRKTLSI
ncbi:MAG: glycosyltransferase family 4 protein [Candidatus Moraniibacteriota bacterium]|nr:MAG: glycosyltransferase family 4 protein [Candidatus Moranbacteria bacterium]